MQTSGWIADLFASQREIYRKQKPGILWNRDSSTFVFQISRWSSAAKAQPVNTTDCLLHVSEILQWSSSLTHSGRTAIIVIAPQSFCSHWFCGTIHNVIIANRTLISAEPLDHDVAGVPAIVHAPEVWSALQNQWFIKKSCVPFEESIVFVWAVSST